MDPLDEVSQLLCDVTTYLKNELRAHDYENSTKDSFGGREIETKRLLERCEGALDQLRELRVPAEPQTPETNRKHPAAEENESSYLDMTAKNAAPPTDYVDVRGPFDGDLKQHQSTKEDCRAGIYDACSVSPQPLTRAALDEAPDAADCPYAGLPASHLSIHKSPKQGQLVRLERRLFFDQTKKLYCGIVGDWMLCYSDGMNGIRPTFCLSLSGVEIEHCGEGKRRDVCFQITDFEAGKKIIFEAKCEVDAKEWIHAIEAAIRGETGENLKRMGGAGNALRKLPTPPVQSKTYLRSEALNDGIYEEPCSLYVQLNEGEEQLRLQPISDDDDDDDDDNDDNENDLKPPCLPAKGRPKTTMAGASAEYDVPKIALLTSGRRSCPGAGQTIESSEELIARNKSEFQIRIKDVHTKLTSHLSSGLGNSPDRLGKNSCKKSPENVNVQSIKTVKIQLFKEKLTPHQSNETSPPTTTTTTTTPMKKWFLNRLNKSNSPEKKRLGQGDKEKENLLFHSDNGCPALQDPKSPKKGKVNMIINQLEANGHLPIFTKNLERFSTGFGDSGEDCNYEPIVTMGKY